MQSQASNVLPLVRIASAVERKYQLKCHVDGVRCELSFSSDDARAAKSCELINSSVAAVFLPVNQ